MKVRISKMQGCSFFYRCVLVVLLLMVFGIAPPLHAEMVGTLPTIIRPQKIAIDGNRLFVTEGATVSIYSLDPLEYKHKFGRQGEGPGEFLYADVKGIGFTICKDKIFIHNRARIFYYSVDGKLLEERRVPHNLRNILPVGDKFAAYQREQGWGKSKLFINLYDHEFKPVKELTTEESSFIVKGKINLFPQFARFCTYKDNLYVLKGENPFEFKVFDKNGKLVFKTQNEFKAYSLTDGFKQRVLEWLEDHIRPREIWQQFKGRIYFPDTLPLIRDVHIDNDCIYIQTFNGEKDRLEVLILDLQGKLKTRRFIDVFKPNLIETIPFTIYKGKLYYLLENEDDEEWELYVNPLNQ